DGRYRQLRRPRRKTPKNRRRTGSWLWKQPTARLQLLQQPTRKRARRGEAKPCPPDDHPQPCLPYHSGRHPHHQHPERQSDANSDLQEEWSAGHGR
ncbi:hypothetical protein HPB47_027087, partial [Ixodes persulcatus]